MKTIHDGESDDRLMQRAVSGDAAAFDAIVRRHQHRLQRFATRMMGGDPARGADVAVGALLRLWESRGSYVPSGRLGGWLLRTAYRQCLDALGGPQNETLEENDLATFDTPHLRLERSALAQAVRDAITELPCDHRAVLVLSVYEEMSYAEIADALDIPPGTVASRRSHAVTLLRRRLASWQELP